MHYARYVKRKSRFNSQQWSTPPHHITPLAELHFCGCGKLQALSKILESRRSFCLSLTSIFHRGLPLITACVLLPPPITRVRGETGLSLHVRQIKNAPSRPSDTAPDPSGKPAHYCGCELQMSGFGSGFRYRCRTFSRKCCPLAVRNRYMHLCGELDDCYRE